MGGNLQLPFEKVRYCCGAIRRSKTSRANSVADRARHFVANLLRGQEQDSAFHEVVADLSGSGHIFFIIQVPFDGN